MASWFISVEFLSCNCLGLCIDLWFVDETNLSRFNTTSDEASTYPMLISLGLLPARWRLKPCAYELVACLPRLLKRRHPKKSDEALADLKRQLTWLSVAEVLAPLDVINVSDNGYTLVCCFFASCFFASSA